MRVAVEPTILIIMQISTPRTRVVAVLGPTNTGKTYLALERMLGHGSGMIGFPLRLLARENYDRAVRLKGARQVALITGEEKIIPSYAKYFFCTVESMPVTRPVAFLAIDEIQLCADPERGHIFTDRLLNARGTEETMFMGAETAKPLIRKLVPDAEYISRPRFSTLSYAGTKKIARMPPRSAVVGFSTADVYAIAELMRRQRGGAAIVMGALSPRTRNAQVEMFQDGSVDYLVATDAIGMGLNLELDHVAFASLRKFDGQAPRDLHPAELAQIAGRAGRHMSDGTFGTTADTGDMAPETVERIEQHRFDPLRGAYWRNAALDYASISALRNSLDIPPPDTELFKVRGADDQRFLDELAAQPDIRSLASTPSQVERLWDVCQVPDFRKSSGDSHTRVLAQIYKFLSGPGGRIDTDWLARQLSHVDRTDGDIDTLLARIAQIRIWTYVSHRADWLADTEHWQARTRETEDRLSDALHDRLTQRFVDQRAAALVKGLRERTRLEAKVSPDGEVEVEGHFVGRLHGFRFLPDSGDGERADRAVTAAAIKALAGRVAAQANDVVTAQDDEFSLTADGQISWRNDIIAQMQEGAEVLRPRIRLVGADLLEANAQSMVVIRLQAWLDEMLAQRLRPLHRLRDAKLEGAARGVAFQLVEGLGTVARKQLGAQLRAMTNADFGRFKRLGVKTGRDYYYVPAMLKPAAAELAALLWSVHHKFREVPPPPRGRASFPAPDTVEVPSGFLHAAGYQCIGPLAIRTDIIERLHTELRKAISVAGGKVDASALNLLGCNRDDMEKILSELGYRCKMTDAELTVESRKRPNRQGKGVGVKQRKGKGKGQKPRQNAGSVAADSPFAILKDLATT